MAFKLTFMEKIGFFLTIFNSKNLTECTLSISPKKKFSDLTDYVEAGKIAKSISGKVTKQTDDGYNYTYEYVFDGKITKNLRQNTASQGAC